MVDIHNHILPGIDDGCKTIEDSISILKEAEKLNINHICVSPHYVKGSKYCANNKKKKELLDNLKEEAKKENINVNLYLGNEVYFENDMYSLIQDNEISTINGSKYLLFELPMVSEVNNLKDVIFSLKVKGIVPVIAHPERYTIFQKDPNKIIPLIEQGCLFQGNLCSLVGIYGSDVKKTIKVLLSHNLLHFLSTDVHRTNSRTYASLNDAINELNNLVGVEYANELLEINPLKAINDEKIDIRETKVIKRGFFSFKI